MIRMLAFTAKTNPAGVASTQLCQRGGRGQAAERVIDLHAVQPLGVMLQKLVGRQLGRIEARLPGRVCEAGGSGIQRCHGLSLSLAGGPHVGPSASSSWLLSALALWLVAQIVPGIEVRGFGAALMATVVIAIVDMHHRTGPAISRVSPDVSHAGPVPAGDERLPAETGVAVHAGLPGRRVPAAAAWLAGADRPRLSCCAAWPGVYVL